MKKERLTAAQRFAALLNDCTGIKTATFRQLERTRRATWAEHCQRMQTALDIERVEGWGWSCLTGRRIDFKY